MNAQANQPTSRRMLGRYEIVAEIARGGMGAVFLARLEGVGGFQRLVAVKLMHRHLASEAQFTHMLLDEARLAAQLHHPNAVGVIDVAESELGLYIVMEYVDGFALDRVLDSLRNAPAEKRIRLGVRIWLDAVRGLTAAHQLKDDEGVSLGIVHRDVSPQNILVGLDGAGRITDFGVARAAARITSSHPGMIKGKPCYMAPEQARAEELDSRADTFALGIVLWEVLAGEMLFKLDGGAAATLLQVINDPIAAPSTITPEAAPLDAVCLKCLERDLDARYPSGRDQYEEVEAAARAAGLLGTLEEVADFMREAFASEIRERKSAIKEHLSAIRGGAASAMQESDIYAVPALSQDERSEAHTSAERPTQKASESGPWHETSEPNRPAANIEELSKAPVSSVTASARALTPAPAQPPRWRAAAFALAACGLVMAGTAAWVLSDPDEDAGAEQGQSTAEEEAERAAEALAHARALAEAAEREASAREAAAAAEARARAAESAGRDAEEARAAAALAEEARAEAERAEEELARQRRAARRERRAQMDGMDSTTMSGDATMEPGFENNPYIR